MTIMATKQLSSSIAELLEKAKQLQVQDKIMQSYRCIKEAQALADATSEMPNPGMPSPPQDRSQVGDLIRDDPSLQHVVDTAVDIETLLEELESSQWQLQRQDSRTKTFYKPGEDDNPFVTVRVEGWVQQPLPHILAALYECDFHPEWFPSALSLGIDRSEVIYKLKRTKLWTHQHIRLPWPFTNRKMDMLVNGVDCMDKEEPVRRVIIQLRTINNNDDAERLKQIYEREDLNIPEMDMDAIAVEVVRGFFVLTPSEINQNMDGEGTFIQFVACIDAKFDTLPTCAINVGLKNVAHWLVGNLAQQAAKVPTDSRYLSRIEGVNADFYTYMHKRMQECMNRDADNSLL
eukprot:TRINITY_DN9989_c0_g2_i1.p1 TRINITY_DN9989_c0_g2~~TRINITY_DN9989_c0_g2_i1.p1  ORF type:complete len:347 (+),score=62.90 TRINITY_DN9989_c0_g2_i1:53-1093(+)